MIYLFDFDGTLVDTNDILAEALDLAVLDVTGLRYAGPWYGDQSTVDQLRKRFIPTSLAKPIRERKFQHYTSMVEVLKPNDNLRGAIIALRKTKAKMGIVSNSPAEAVHKAGVVSRLGGEPPDLRFWDHIVTGELAKGKGKPHPRLYQEAMRAFRTRPEKVKVFEDSDVGEQAARAAGIKNVVRVTHSTLAKEVWSCVS